MKRSTFCLVLVLTLLMGVSAASARSHQSSVTKNSLRAAPKLSCSIKGIVFSPTRISVAPKSGCFVGGKNAPSVGSWTAKSYDITAVPPTAKSVPASVQPCYYGTGAGLGKSLSVPSPSKYIKGQGAPQYGYPALYQVSFKLIARWGKQRASATKTVLKRSPGSNVLCGAPPKMVSFSGPAGACVWSVFPNIVGASLSTQAAQVGCPSANSVCTWRRGDAIQEKPYLIFGYSFRCLNGYMGHLGYQVGYSPDASNHEKCEGFDLQGASMYPLIDAGPGSIYVYAFVATFMGGQQLPVLPPNQKPTNLWSSGWFNVTGNTPPC